MADGAQRAATYEDVLAAPPHTIAQVLDGKLVVHPRPASLHAGASSALGEELGPPFKRGRGGPGGWVILDEPELHLRADIVVPDLAGWRRERMPEMPDAPFFSLPPDWVCEVTSPTTASVDRVRKARIYGRERVQHVWLVDPGTRVFEVWRLDGETYRVVVTAADDERVRAEPFDAIELDLALLWAR
ncbi:MAG: Uma2 family endonuclease [Polyangiaceae bacterium]|jgi:Uma2 family endonuclease|nr:Uma2 family endonuclease [Polyangiaceae bacterium]